MSGDQLFYGPVYGDSMAQSIFHLGGQNPHTVNQMQQTYGRHLGGFGHTDDIGREIEQAEEEDDTYGSGIFDDEDHEGTANVDTGIFASHNSLPGFVARERPFSVNEDVTDITDDADVVTIPAGGLYYVGKHKREATRSPYFATTPEPHKVPPAPTGIRRVPPSTHGRRVLTSPATKTVAQKNIVQPPRATFPISPRKQPLLRAAPDIPRPSGVPFRSTVNVSPAGAPFPIGTGALPNCPPGQAPDIDTLECVDTPQASSPSKGASTAQLAFAGIILGAVAGIFVGTLRQGSNR